MAYIALPAHDLAAARDVEAALGPFVGLQFGQTTAPGLPAASARPRPLSLVAFAQELLGHAGLQLHVVRGDLGPEAHLTRLDLPLVLPGLALPPRLLVLELAVVQDATDWGLNGRSNLDQAGVLLARELQA